VALAGAGWAEEQDVLVCMNELRRRQLEDDLAIHLFVEARLIRRARQDSLPIIC
jgi:hypothetical protein